MLGSVDKKDDSVGNASELLARSIYRQVDEREIDSLNLKEALMLSRKFFLNEQIHGVNHHYTVISISTLCDILLLYGDPENEVSDLLERSLEIYCRYEGSLS